MNKKSLSKILFIIVFFLLSYTPILSQSSNYQTLFGNKDTLVKEIRFYGSLNHRHQDFFNKAFSFQGIEAGAIFNHKIFLGAYGSTFATNLTTKINNNNMYVFMWQAGMSLGRIYNHQKALHSGWLLNVGYFSLVGDDTDFGFFKSNEPQLSFGGLVISPEVYAEINVASWMKFRTGLAYSFYSFEDQSQITKNDLQNISVNFGFIFGKFN